jgi:uncharacterized protein (DUF427 family)
MAYRAVWNGQVLAESDHTVRVEGNHYFPPDSLNTALLRPSSTRTVCPWKGTARYYTVTVDGKENKDAAWYYPSPRPAAAEIKDHVAFWHGVKVERVPTPSPAGTGEAAADSWWRRLTSRPRG